MWGCTSLIKIDHGDHYWLVVWNMFYCPIYWESSSQLTFIFFRGVETTNQISVDESGYMNPIIKKKNEQLFPHSLDFPRIELPEKMVAYNYQVPPATTKSHVSFFLVIR